MKNTKNNSANSLNHIVSFIIAGVLFAVTLLLCTTANNFIAGMLTPTVFLSYITALTGAVIICVRYSVKNKLMNPAGFTPRRDTFYYMKRMGIIVIITVLLSLGTSIIGAFVNALFGGFMMRSSNLFLRGFILKLPVFIIYLSIIYKMFIRYGYTDCGKKIFNPNFKLLTFIITLIIMTPDAVYNSMFNTDPSEMAQMFMVNIQTLLSPNVNKFTIDSDGWSYVNPDFTTANIILVLITVFLTFAIQTGVAMFAYRRGKKIFMKERIRIIDEYEIDENI